MTKTYARIHLSKPEEETYFSTRAQRPLCLDNRNCLNENVVQVCGTMPCKDLQKAILLLNPYPHRGVFLWRGAVASRCVQSETPNNKPVGRELRQEDVGLCRNRLARKLQTFEVDGQTGRTNHQTSSPLRKDTPTAKRRAPEEQACLMDRRTDKRTDGQTDDCTPKNARRVRLK